MNRFTVTYNKRLIVVLLINEIEISLFRHFHKSLTGTGIKYIYNKLSDIYSPALVMYY